MPPSRHFSEIGQKPTRPQKHGGQKSELPSREASLSGGYPGTASIHSGNPGFNSAQTKEDSMIPNSIQASLIEGPQPLDGVLCRG